MKRYDVKKIGEKVLKQESVDVEHGEDVTELVKDMYHIMKMENGIGLAAPQIGISKNIFVIDHGGKKAFINPRIIKESGMKWPFLEGCLSIPGRTKIVWRKAYVDLEWYDENWNKHRQKIGGIECRVIQHEYDHLKGILFIER